VWTDIPDYFAGYPFVPIGQAAKVAKRPINTVRTWARLEQVNTLHVEGHVLVDWRSVLTKSEACRRRRRDTPTPS